MIHDRWAHQVRLMKKRDKRGQKVISIIHTQGRSRGFDSPLKVPNFSINLINTL